MKKITAFLLLLVCISVSAQNQRFIYEYTYVKDSLEKDKTTSEDMYLDITKNGSRYYSYEIFKMDSTIQAEVEKKVPGGFSGVQAISSFSIGGFSGKGSVAAVIEKKYPTYEISQIEYLGMDAYIVENQKKMEWKITSETEKIGDFTAQKATTKMYGRTWNAWFASALPFQDGPYKFSGLPGLIVKVEDTSKSHVLTLKAVENLPANFEMKSSTEKAKGRTPIKLSYEKFKKAYKENRESPMKSTKQMLSTVNLGSFQMNDQNGNKIDMNKMMKDAEDQLKEANKKDNNILELDLLR